MKLAHYQTEAARTIPNYDTDKMRTHALLGLNAEYVEFKSALDEQAEQEERDPRHALLELGDMAWMIAELCTAEELNMHTILKCVSDASGDVSFCDIGRLCGVYQKTYQGHAIDYVKIGVFIRNIWAAMMLCASYLGADMETVLEMNIRKLRARYPDGFDKEHSLNRKAGDL